MSFWAKIGLVDKKTVLELQSEIVQLRTETAAVSEQNRKLLEELIHIKACGIERFNTDVEARKNETKILENEFKSRIEDLKAEVLCFEKTMSDNFAVSNKNMETSYKDIVQEITKDLKMVQDSLDALINGNGVSNKTNAEKINAILEETHSIASNVTEIEKMGSDIKVLSESLSNLWTIMKAIWIDSLLTDIDKSV